MRFWQVFQNDEKQMMKIKYQVFSGGRVGRSPYRDHNINKIISVIVGLDTAGEGLLDQWIPL